MTPVNIFFTPGMFGSTLEYMLRTFTQDYYQPISGSVIMHDGSAHNFKKELHPIGMENIDSILQGNYNISTFVPSAHHDLVFVIDKVKDIIKNHNNILIYADTPQDAELNMLFQYHKIAKGSGNLGIGILFGVTTSEDFAAWNPNYTKWQDLSRWEFREWFSLYYAGMLQDQYSSEILDSINLITVSNMQLLTNLKSNFIKICRYYNLSVINQQELESFVTIWTEAQHYIVLKYQVINQILAHILNYNEKKRTFWWKDLDIIQESILQKRLRDLGYEIRCDGLNKFPKDIKSLYNLLERC
jgi:hypothetical protein